MSYTSKYAQNEMNRAVSGKDKDPKKKRVQTYKAGGSGQDTKGKEKREKKRAKHNEKVEKRRSKDTSEYRKTGNKEKYSKKSMKKSRTYKI